MCEPVRSAGRRLSERTEYDDRDRPQLRRQASTARPRCVPRRDLRVIGDVAIGDESSIWYATVLRVT